MASITLAGTLLDPNSDLSVGDELRFTHDSTTGQTLKGAVSKLIIGQDGAYSLPLQYGLVLVEYRDKLSTQFKNLGVATVNGDNPATTIPELLNALVPVSSAELIEFQTILADAVTAKNAAVTAETGAVAAESTLLATQITTTALISSTATFSAETVINTTGFTTSGDGGAGSWKQNGVTGQTVSQSPAQLGNALLNDGNGDVWALVHGGTIDPMKLGATEAAVDNYDFLQAALNGGKIIDLQSNYFDYNGTLTSSKVGAGIIGNGSATCGLQPTNTTSNSISFADPAGPMRGAVFKGFSISPTPNSKTAGKALKLDGVRNFIINDVIIDKGFWGIHMLGCSQGFIDNVLIIYENDNGGVISGRKYIRIEETTNTNIGSKHSGDLFFTNINGRCGGTPYCEYGIEIHSGDGIWFDNYHIGSCTGANIYINADRVTRCTGLKFANGWHDIGTGKGTWIKGTTPNTIGDYTFNSVRHLGGNGGDVGIEIDGDATEIVFDGPDTTVSGYLKQGIIIKAAFTGSCEIKAHVYKCSLAGSGLYDGIKDESTTASVKIENCTVSGTNHRYHINSQIAKPTTIRNNDVSVDNAVTGALSYVHTTGLIVEGNRGFNPVGASSDPVLPSPWTITNDLGYNLQLVIHGGTGVSFVMNGTTIQAARNEGTFTLPKDGDIVITYTTAPYVYFIGM